MSRDLRAALAPFRCWDAITQAIFEARGEPVDDVALQNREELLGLCALIEALGVRSYLEIGVWTGGTTRAIRALFPDLRMAACDQGYAETLGLRIGLPPDVAFFRGDSGSPAYLRWRAGLGHIDLVLIDANHAYHAVKADFERERALPHRLLALHDITGANRHTVGVKRLWGEIQGGWKREIVRPHRELGLDHPTMGIGVWSREDPGGV